MRRLKRFLVPVVTAGLVMGLCATPASAVSERHFIHIVAKGLPRWSADAQLYAQDGSRPYDWKQNTKSGGSLRWNFTWNGDNGWLDVKVKGLTPSTVTKTVTKTKLKLDADYCFKVTADGHPEYTGDSKTGGCT